MNNTNVKVPTAGLSSGSGSGDDVSSGSGDDGALFSFLFTCGFSYVYVRLCMTMYVSRLCTSMLII